MLSIKKPSCKGGFFMPQGICTMFQIPRRFCFPGLTQGLVLCCLVLDQDSPPGSTAGTSLPISNEVGPEQIRVITTMVTTITSLIIFT